MELADAGEPEALADRVRSRFEERFGRAAEVVARAPGRVNLIGEHTDYNAGLVLPLALPHSTYVALARRSDQAIRMVSEQQPDSWDGRLDHLGPGRLEGWGAYGAGVLWALREAGWTLPGVDLYIDGQVPLGAGLSSSAALECAVAVGIVGLLKGEMPDSDREQLAEVAIRAETQIVGAPTGGMDQYASMLARAGCALLIDFEVPPGPDRATPVPLDLEDHCLLVTDTRVAHALVDGGYGDRRSECEAAARALGVDSLRRAAAHDVDLLNDAVLRRRARHVVSEIERVRACVRAIRSSELLALGPIFAASHASMRDDFEISCAELDLAVDVALDAGATGARMTGGGFGGSTVALVPTRRRLVVAAAIDEAFRARGWPIPRHLIAHPSAAASLC